MLGKAIRVVPIVVVLFMAAPASALLEDWEAAVDRGNPNDARVAINELKALVNQVEAQANKKIAPEVATEVIQRVNAIIAALGG